MTEHPILISPDTWLNSQLSIARHYGGVIYNMRTYMVEPLTNFLVMREFWKLLRPSGELSFETLARAATKPYGEEKALDLCRRLNGILKAKKRPVFDNPILIPINDELQ